MKNRNTIEVFPVGSDKDPYSIDKKVEGLELSSLYSPRQIAVINSVYSLLGSRIAGEEDLKIAGGLNSLLQLQKFEKLDDLALGADDSTLLFDGSLLGSPTNLDDQSRARLLRTSRELLVPINNLRYEGKRTEIVPTIIKALSYESPDNVSVIDDLQKFFKQRRAEKATLRQVAALHLRRACAEHLNAILLNLSAQGKSLKVRLYSPDEAKVDVSPSELILSEIHRDELKEEWLDLTYNESSRRRRVKFEEPIKLDVVKMRTPRGIFRRL